MLYSYNQLNRITKARDLTGYTVTGGFAARSQGSGAYDADYSYDANGNLLTLQRRNEQGGVQDDFDYTYIPGTNKLAFVDGLYEIESPSSHKSYEQGRVDGDGNVYETIDVSGGAHVPSGHSANLYASQSITLKPDFTVASGGSFTAKVGEEATPAPEDEYNYRYDRIGNLVSDKGEGIEAISWTPYGKVKAVQKTGGERISFRYDAAGHRVEKQVTDSAGQLHTTRYVRDASGNVMAVYDNTGLKEQPIYGSSRLGIYRGGRKASERRLGYKRYELSNHLGNVMATVTDNLDVDDDQVEARVLTLNDYYPFGSAMSGRTYSSEEYRYGFNGMEKDDEISGSGNSYTAEFWQYDSRLGRRWNVDPIVKFYESPYAAFANNPIWFIDPSGADTVLVNRNSGRPLDDLMKRGGEDVIFMSGEGGTWEGAEQLFYEIQEITGKGGGTPSRRGDPVKWRWINMYGVTQTLQDQTERFNEVMEKWETFAETGGEWIQNSIPLETRAIFMLVNWRALVTDSAPMDIKDPRNPDSFSPAKIGEWSWQNGRLTRYDDYGNINYGRAGAAYGFGKGTLLAGSNANQIWKDTKSLFGVGQTSGMGDDKRDVRAVEHGVSLYKNKKR